MPDSMPKQRPPYLQREVSRHGTVAWYFRAPGGKRIRIRAAYGSAGFWAAYEAAKAGRAINTGRHPHMTLAWAIDQFMASPAWAARSAETRKQISYQFAHITANAGMALVTEIRRRHVIEARDRRAAVPSDANKYVRAMAMLMQFAVDQEWIQASPVVKIGKLRTSKTGDGFYTWTRADLAAFLDRWPLGTMPRLAFEIILCTGLRRGDVRRFGRQHVKAGAYEMRTGKTGMVAAGDMPPRLQQAISATATGEMTFLLSDHGRPFSSAASFGNWFGDRCREAGIAGNAHGIRKGVATIAAEEGMTEAQMNSFFTWAHGSGESATYIRKADRTRMARVVAEAITRTFEKGAGEEGSKPLKRKVNPK